MRLGKRGRFLSEHQEWTRIGSKGGFVSFVTTTSNLVMLLPSFSWETPTSIKLYSIVLTNAATY